MRRQREICVRPVVRYIVTDYSRNPDGTDPESIEFGEFDNVHRANVVASSMAVAEADAAGTSTIDLHVRVVRGIKLRIDRVSFGDEKVPDAPALADYRLSAPELD